MITMTGDISGSILESKSMHAIFRKRAKKRVKKSKIFENLGKNVQNLEIFWKRAASCVQLSHAWNSLNMPSIFKEIKSLILWISKTNLVNNNYWLSFLIVLNFF